MDALRTAYEKTAFHRMGIPFDAAIKLDAVRIALEGSAKRCQFPAPLPAKRHAAS